MVVYVLFCIFLLLLTKIECFLCMFAGNLREFIYMGISDEKLWESCLKGDKEAFRELYCRFYALLRNYGIKLLPDKNLVEDCVQDIFINLIQNLARLDPANQSERLRTQLEKKLRLTRYKDTYDLKTKLIRYGLSLGYDYDAVLDAAGELIQTNDEPCDDF